ncbi:UNKNOWN [Stylonychia lemnae]|uniref:Uncharacterized protein n=1 Tax=Stylonychia lemnae TaxID=5949 RepID=A0A078A9V0_STYLE|nr:UNKNOWN [Stylonychia lemnae]|eukprot:CDW77573.1 UNKNOWN [Stylonychia lemnae]
MLRQLKKKTHSQQTNKSKNDRIQERPKKRKRVVAEEEIEISSQSDDYIQRKQNEKQTNKRTSKANQKKNSRKLKQKYKELKQILKSDFNIQIEIKTNNKIKAGLLALNDRINFQLQLQIKQNETEQQKLRQENELQQKKQVEKEIEQTKLNKEKSERKIDLKLGLITSFCVNKKEILKSSSPQKDSTKDINQVTVNKKDNQKQKKATEKEEKAKQKEEEEKNLVDCSQFSNDQLKEQLNLYGINVKSSMTRKKQERIFSEMFTYTKHGQLPAYL